MHSPNTQLCSYSIYWHAYVISKHSRNYYSSVHEHIQRLLALQLIQRSLHSTTLHQQITTLHTRTKTQGRRSVTRRTSHYQNEGERSTVHKVFLSVFLDESKLLHFILDNKAETTQGACYEHSFLLEQHPRPWLLLCVCFLSNIQDIVFLVCSSQASKTLRFLHVLFKLSSIQDIAFLMCSKQSQEL